jgi:dTDP-4-dehydrorhamnose reductase
LQEFSTAAGDEVFAYDRPSLDIRDASAVEHRILQHGADAVINCAAWTDVDGCEKDPEKAFEVNARGPENLARASKKAGSAFLTISTDYVFDGRKDGPYTQRDTPAPLSVYGKAKLEGEQRAQAAYARTIVVRSGFIFGVGGKNFLSRVVDLARAGGPIAAIGDAAGTPTSARDLTARLRELVSRDLPGTYHVVNSGEGSTYEQFARLALKLARLDDSILTTVTDASLNRPAQRPLNSRLRCLLSEAIGLTPMPAWEDAVRRFVEELASK